MSGARADRSLPEEDPSDQSRPSLSIEELAAQRTKGDPAQVSRTVNLLNGAIWRDPDRIDEWIGELSPEHSTAVYCAYSVHVGNVTSNPQGARL